MVGGLPSFMLVKRWEVFLSRVLRQSGILACMTFENLFRWCAEQQYTATQTAILQPAAGMLLPRPGLCN